MPTPIKIPQRAVYKAAEVCAIAKLQPYVLRSWETEFPNLGIEQSGSHLRVYRRAHLDLVLRIKELLFVEGLTLGAARRKILQESPATEDDEQQSLEQLLGADAQARVEDVKEQSTNRFQELVHEKLAGYRRGSDCDCGVGHRRTVGRTLAGRWAVSHQA